MKKTLLNNSFPLKVYLPLFHEHSQRSLYRNTELVVTLRLFLRLLTRNSGYLWYFVCAMCAECACWCRFLYYLSWVWLCGKNAHFFRCFDRCTALVRVSSSKTKNLSLTITMCHEYFTKVTVSSVEIKHWMALSNVSLLIDWSFLFFIFSIEWCMFDCVRSLIEHIKHFCFLNHVNELTCGFAAK